MNKIKFLAAFHLGPVKKSDVFISALLETLKDKKWKVISSTTGYDFGRDVPENYDDYLATISKNRKKQLNRRKRNLEKLGNITFEYHRDLTEEGWNTIINELEEVENKAWISKTGSSYFIGNEKQQFWNGLMQDGWYRKAFSVWMIYIDNKPISFFSAMDLGKQRFVFASSYDQNYAHYNVGTLLETELIKYSIEDDDVNFLNVGPGEFGYKEVWGYKEFQEICRFFVFPPTVIGRTTYYGVIISNRLKGWVKNIRGLFKK